ncbi:outer membrane protein assembly factor [Aquimarina sp. ERC-38]|uniref:translocation and assembly module lipoprotein TamL n=1 Tax=Aquimarina sp. ERC-38 TaxID=2949996 RepID=UPI0022479D5B|nr:BamA/TamA family outer membrane protein [Aquimarina sp. ERC-38]UZO82547.1 outer membrane protein assembly factor [Aquimarina sp. ERC-38]
MKYFILQIGCFLSILLFLQSCNAVKKVAGSDHLLEENTIYVDSVKIKDSKIKSLLSQQPNVKLLGSPLRLHIYNLANKNPDSAYALWLSTHPKLKKNITKLLSEKQVKRLGVGYAGFNQWLEETGQAPVVIDSAKTIKSEKRLQAYYWNNGWFNVSTGYKIDYSDNKRATVDYYIQPRQPYTLAAVKTRITSKVADSIYQLHLDESLLKTGAQYKTADVEAERERLTTLFRNSGLYHFEKEFITYDADTINTDHRINLNLSINNQSVTEDDATYVHPFTVHKISKVHIFSDYNYANRDKIPQDTTNYRKYSMFSYGKRKFTRKALTNSILITPGEIFRDQDRTLTYNQISNLRIFKYPNIKYEPDLDDPKGEDLIATILLTPRKKYSANFEFDVSRSTIQVFGLGFGGSLLIRNVFKGAELLEISGRGSVGSSRDPVNTESEFFDIAEIGMDFKLTFPKIIFPFDLKRFIPKYMSPTTNLIFGINAQQNIGLDKQNASGIFNYTWRPNKTLTHQVDVINVQYVRNLNTNNFFNIYRNSFQRLNTIAVAVLNPGSAFFNENNENTENTLSIPVGADSFLAQSLNPETVDEDITPDQLQEIRNINERKERLTEDNLIFTTSYTFIKNTRENLFDETFYRFRTKLAAAGNLLNTIADFAKLERNENDRFSIFGVEFSQYAKLELDYIKHWDLGRKRIFAIRTFGGLAVPYGNANSIPFARSFFAGGPNDNRAWLPYELGPGSSGGQDEFNEANLKLAFNIEYRYPILGALQGALFADIGNIWNYQDNITDEASRFEGIRDLRELAVGSGFGLRYDFDFFVVRLDLGFKTFNPANNADQRWFRGYNFSKTVFNVGINYPF